MKGAIVLNRYYSDGGLEYIESRLKDAFAKKGAALDTLRVFPTLAAAPQEYSFALFFDKDLPLARFLEANGVRLFNSAAAVEICDDKEKTYSALRGLPVPLPDTVFAPLMYETVDNYDGGFLDFAAKTLSFPVVVKENRGSRGMQVYLAKNAAELKNLYGALKKRPHHYQRFYGERGRDLRVYVIGGEPVAALARENTTDFRANAALGSISRLVDPPAKIADCARLIAARLGLEYGALDFSDGGEVFFEANSNAYFTAVEGFGVKISELFADYVLKAVNNA
ncbi:MAG: hypothetical protein LBP26_00240 [Clostridiales bacterium]|jgi:RimK family alpha-L-glutamate ligase|nr:hypothetical protein [Clostridiales bacterium]